MKSVLALGLVAACAKHPAAAKQEPAAAQPSATAPTALVAPSDAPIAPTAPSAPVTLPPAPPVPLPPQGLPALPDSAALAAVTPAEVALGELLFWDPRLSTSGALACASCHVPARGYSGAVAATVTGERNLRRTQALVNVAWASEYGWDGRFTSLDEQLRAHVKGQLGAPLDVAIAPLAQKPIYAAHLARIGGTPEQAALRALAAYVLTRYDGDAPWDELERGGAAVPAAGSGKAGDPIAAGYALFTGKAQCAVCHTPPLYTDFGYHNIAGRLAGDPGRGLVDRRTGAFQTPSLRGAAFRPAFFHDGSVTTLEAAIRAHGFPGALLGSGAGVFDPDRVDPALQHVTLTDAELADLTAFVRALSASRPAPAKPALP